MGRHVTKHIHRFIRISGKYTPIWKCGDGSCNYFIYYSQEHTLFGRDSLCWECGNVFKMSEDAMQEERPRCNSCRFPETENIADILDSIAKS